MATVRVKLRKSGIKSTSGVIYYQIIHKCETKQINSGYTLSVHEWDSENAKILTPTNNHHSINYINLIKNRTSLDINRLNQIIHTFEKQQIEYTASDVAAKYNKLLQGITLHSFMDSIISKLTQTHQIRTSETYSTTLQSFMRFTHNHTQLLLTDINAELIASYQHYLKAEGLTMNTISFYMRILRAVYNRAIDLELVEPRQPFKHVYTGVDKTIKRALTLLEVKHLKALDLSHEPKLAIARDMFLFSFYTRGMSFVDMSYLRNRNLNNNILTYRRRKTGQLLNIRWEQSMQDIIDKNPPTPNSEYLLPIITSKDKDERKQYKNALSLTNNRLKKIGERLGISIPLTMYVARHSWASIAKSNNIPISVISEGMGHDSETTTQIYLASLDTSIIDHANRTIIELL